LAGTNVAALTLREFEHVGSDVMRKSAVARAVERVAKHLGNTPAVCRQCYIHPAIFEGFLDATLLTTLAEKTRIYLAAGIEVMSAEKAAVVAFLRLRLGQLAEKPHKDFRGNAQGHRMVIREPGNTRVVSENDETLKNLPR
jgi:DNA topoisomerase-1